MRLAIAFMQFLTMRAKPAAPRPWSIVERARASYWRQQAYPEKLGSNAVFESQAQQRFERP